MLVDFLNNKPLYYDEIDYTRMPRIYETIKSHLKIPKIIHLIGTNGKGTTGRFLASALHSLGYKTGHYTSPHILEFNERIWLNGKDIDNKLLEKAHQVLQEMLSVEDSTSLSYFEYTTLLAILVYKNCDYVVLEAGLGGEHDATAVFPKELTLVTPIGFDHEAFLGSTLQEIASTKLNAIQKDAILANQYYDEVYNIAYSGDANIYKINDFLDDEDLEKIKQISKNLSLPKYLEENLKLSISALKFLEINYESNNFNNARLFGRLSKLNENIYVDVGHNTLAATSILEALSPQKFVLVYNTYKDKNYKDILKILKPIIHRVEIIEVNEKRIENEEQLHISLKELKIEYSPFELVKPNTNYLVFGSFSVVERFLKGYSE